jgi:hypothetical protein
MTRVRRLILLLPLARPHTGRHQLRARGNADAARPAQRPATALLKPSRTWYQPPPPKTRQRVTGTLPADITAGWKRERGNS